MYQIRFATQKDAATIAELVRQLAVYEKLEHQVVSTAESFEEILTRSGSPVEILVSEIDRRVVGFALFFTNFSTFLGRPGLYLEDLFVQPEYRRQGIGRAFFDELLRIAKERAYGRVEWAVLDWNQSAIEFYQKKIGADLLPDWRICRLLV